MSTPDAPWWELAACHGMAPLFDAEGDGGRPSRQNERRREALARRYEAATRVCATCPVRRQCEQDIRPGRDEGVRAGRVLPPIFAKPERGDPKAVPGHGHGAGYKRHIRAGEKPCRACAEGAARERQLRRREAS